jgi:hypothetical protein
MKKLIYKLGAFLGGVTLILVSYFTQPSAEINKTANAVSYAVPDTQFHIGAFDNGWYSQYKYIIDSLHFNTWHNYSGIDYGWYNMKSDNYRDPITDSVSGIVSENKKNGMRTYMDRPIVEYIVAGQRVDYQCESVPLDNPYWFYSYTTSLNNEYIYDTTDNSQYGTGERVKYCHKDVNYPVTTPVFIDSGLKSNREMSLNGVRWLSDNRWDWYVMPRIRIDSAYAAGTSHNEDTVCRIKITGWYGNVVKDIGILVKNFKEYNMSTYSGNYLDMFYFRSDQDSLKIDTSLWRNFINESDLDFFAFDWTKYSCNDIKILWTGKCDMWIDRVRLENYPAHQYLTNKEDWILNKLDSEINLAQANKRDYCPNYFYFEECEFSHFPAIKELNRQIMQKTSNTNTLIIWLNYDLFRAHIPGYPWGDNSFLNANQLKKYLHDDDSLNTIVMGSYALEGFSDAEIGNNHYWMNSYHPSTLWDSCSYTPNRGILSYTSSPTFYDNWLQTHLDTGRGGTKLIYIDKLMDGLSKQAPDMRIINCPQAHLWYSPVHKLKEPSNEELELQTCLGITYNAKGTMYFAYSSGNCSPYTASIYYRGIVDMATSDSCYPRYNSVYHQNKFERIEKISKKLNKWGPLLMRFNKDNINSYVFRDPIDRTALYANSYFHHFFTLRPGGSPGSQSNCEGDFTPSDVSGWFYDCPEYTYLQVATFGSIEPNSQYFMVVNRRCSPYINDNSDDNIGGHRKVRAYIRSNYSAFSISNNWNIIDCENEDNVVATFDKTNPGYVDLGYFLPGEGKLFKIMPDFTKQK